MATQLSMIPVWLNINIFFLLSLSITGVIKMATSCEFSEKFHDVNEESHQGAAV